MTDAPELRKYRLFGYYDYWGMEDAETGESVKNDCDMDWVRASDAEREIARLRDALALVLAWHDKGKHTAGKVTLERSNAFAKVRAAMVPSRHN